MRTSAAAWWLVVAAGASAQEFAATFERGAVAAAHPAASEAGARMLRAGGNAVDAAVAASFTLSVVRPQSCGIGGGGFMVVCLPEDPTHGRVVTAINYRETAPAASSPGMFTAPGLAQDASTDSGLAVAVPGTVAGLLHALGRFGTMERAAVLEPAIEAAREGFAADAPYVVAVREGAGRLDERERAERPYLWNELMQQGRVEVGDLVVNARQALMLEAISERGAAAFYAEPRIVAAVEGAGGALSAEDMAGYAPVEVEPLRFEFAGRTFLTMPPPSSGGVVLAQAFGILERRGVVERQDSRWTPADSHVLVEAWKHGFADRAEWLGDPAFVDVPLERLLSGEYIDERAALFDPERTLAPESYGTRASPAGTAGPPDDSGTSHVCAVDQWGGAVACTETINLAFGSLISVEELGFCLNNEMDDFTARPGEPNAFGLVQSARNAPEAGMRPLSSMTPTIVLDEDGAVAAVAGAAGGPRIITATMQVLVNVLVRGMEAGEAVAWPRLHHQWMPEALRFEEGARDLAGPKASVMRMWRVREAAALAERGHTMQVMQDAGVAQLIVREGEGWRAACDPRGGGRPAGH
ncbi:MAG TPA: gamma-glutamyltransferase [Phycisphaerales bacterium]|nr:gamma-glutamyltransferase [Phycisphaerales bacterium]